jgi:hypothetical protein
VKVFFFSLLAAITACGAPPPKAVSIQPVALATAPTATTPEKPRPPAMTIVVTDAQYGAMSLWRAHADGRVEPVAFPWAPLHNIDTVTPSPDGREIAYVEGGSSFGPVLVRDLASGSKTIVAAFVAHRELAVVAWSPNGRKILYSDRSVAEIPSCSRGIHDCRRRGPKSYRVYDRDDAKTTALDVTGELVTWLPSGDVLVSNEDGGDLARIDETTKTRTPLEVGPYFLSTFSLDAANGRLLSAAFNDTTKRSEIVALDLATWTRTTIAPPAPYASYGSPSASASGKHVAWLAPVRPRGTALVVDGKQAAGPLTDVASFAWIDDTAIVLHYSDRLDVVSASDGAVRGSTRTN